MLSRKGYSSRFPERLGFLPPAFKQNSTEAIWLHAVSVGEVISLLPLLRLLRKQLPTTPLYLSTSTQAGRNIADQQATALVDGIFFLPFDYAGCLRRAFKTIRPALLVIVETEIWPNLFALAHYSGTALAVINGRVSDRTWPTYKRWKRLFISLLQLPELIQVQSQVDYDRYAELGAPQSVLLIDANLKYDAALSDVPLHLPTFGAEQIWIAASTVGPNERGSLTPHNIDEDDIVLSTFQDLSKEFQRLLLILAPRQPARFEEVAAKLKGLKLNFRRRSRRPEDLPLPGVLLLDTMGELARSYPLAAVVFVGGSIAPRGGHNIIEPAAAGAPVIIGPHMQNFQAITQDFLEADAILQLREASELTSTVRGLLLNADQGRQLGDRARTLVSRQQGISQRALDRLMPLYLASHFHRPHSLPIQILLNGLAWLWQVGGIYKRQQAEHYAAKQEPLPVPVISIGGISMGGTGKTPFTIAVAKLLQERNLNPAILTRGYRRQSKKIIVAEAGASLPVSDTGDEAQILIRSQVAPVGIGVNRYETAQSLLHQFPVTDILLLDDGFQHARLPRAVDIVLIDALNPFSNGQVVPAGNLREPLSALSRAHIAVITRCDSDTRFSAIAAKLHCHNESLSVFRTDTVTGDWRSAVTGQITTLPPSRKVAAFCGLGNPYSFWTTLKSLQVEVVYQKAFRDHHRYSLHDLRQLSQLAQASGADALVTTEKDYFNLPNAASEIEILYLPIELVIRDAERFLHLIAK